MSRRGSAQLLLLSLRSRRVLGWTIGVTATAVLLAAFAHTGRDFPLFTQTGLAQMLRQSAWERALAGLPEQAPWPWLESSSQTTGSVPRLGLSASVFQETGNEALADRLSKASESGPAKDPHLSQFGEVGISDRITVTTADGASGIYDVIGPKVVDPHLAETEPPSGTDPALCLPPQASKADQPATPVPQPEHKL